jgi:hypothetical protein
MTGMLSALAADDLRRLCHALEALLVGAQDGQLGRWGTRPSIRADVRDRKAFARRQGWPRGTTACCRQGVKRNRQPPMRLGPWEEESLVNTFGATAFYRALRVVVD